MIFETSRAPARTKTVVGPLHPRRVLDLALVSRNGEALVDAYLRRAGVSTHGTRSIERAADIVLPSASAVVLFADEFPREALEEALAAIRARRPELLVVIVTQHPGSFATLQVSEQSAILVLPKPVFGWNILDAIRAHLEPASARGAFMGRLRRLLSRRP